MNKNMTPHQSPAVHLVSPPGSVVAKQAPLEPSNPQGEAFETIFKFCLLSFFESTFIIAEVRIYTYNKKEQQ